MDKEPDATADDGDEKNNADSDENAIALAAALGQVAHLPFMLTALILGGIPALGLATRACWRMWH
jgi:hypothetical protein